mgnify:CR=1 FL=1
MRKKGKTTTKKTTKKTCTKKSCTTTKTKKTCTKKSCKTAEYCCECKDIDDQIDDVICESYTNLKWRNEECPIELKFVCEGIADPCSIQNMYAESCHEKATCDKIPGSNSANGIK